MDRPSPQIFTESGRHHLNFERHAGLHTIIQCFCPISEKIRHNRLKKTVNIHQDCFCPTQICLSKEPRRSSNDIYTSGRSYSLWSAIFLQLYLLLRKYMTTRVARKTAILRSTVIRPGGLDARGISELEVMERFWGASDKLLTRMKVEMKQQGSLRLGPMLLPESQKYGSGHKVARCRELWW